MLDRQLEPPEQEELAQPVLQPVGREQQMRGLDPAVDPHLLQEPRRPVPEAHSAMFEVEHRRLKAALDVARVVHANPASTDYRPAEQLSRHVAAHLPPAVERNWRKIPAPRRCHWLSLGCHGPWSAGAAPEWSLAATARCPNSRSVGRVCSGRPLRASKEVTNNRNSNEGCTSAGDEGGQSLVSGSGLDGPSVPSTGLEVLPTKGLAGRIGRCERGEQRVISKFGPSLPGPPILGWVAGRVEIDPLGSCDPADQILHDLPARRNAGRAGHAASSQDCVDSGSSMQSGGESDPRIDAGRRERYRRDSVRLVHAASISPTEVARISGDAGQHPRILMSDAGAEPSRGSTAIRSHPADSAGPPLPVAGGAAARRPRVAGPRGGGARRRATRARLARRIRSWAGSATWNHMRCWTRRRHCRAGTA